MSKQRKTLANQVRFIEKFGWDHFENNKSRFIEEFWYDWYIMGNNCFKSLFSNLLKYGFKKS
jgi:hypothetical protein